MVFSASAPLFIILPIADNGFSSAVRGKLIPVTGVAPGGGRDVDVRHEKKTGMTALRTGEGVDRHGDGTTLTRV